MSDLIQSISVKGINKISADKLVTEGVSGPNALIGFDLSEMPNSFWIDAFRVSWVRFLEQDLIAAGEYTIRPGLTEQEKKAHRDAIFDLQRRIRNPRESGAPFFKNSEMRRDQRDIQQPLMCFYVHSAKLYGGFKKYTQRIVEVVAAANRLLPDHPPLLSHMEKAKNEASVREAKRLAAENVLAEVQQALTASDQAEVAA